MAFDLSPALSPDPGRNQIREGGLNSHSNCGPDTFANLMTMVGYPMVAPQAFTDAEYGQSYLGGEDANHCIDFIQHHPDLFPAPPEITWEGVDIDRVEAYGHAGYPLGVAGTVDGPTVRFTPGAPYGHFSILLAHTPDDLYVIRNVWGWWEEQLTRDQFLGAINTVVVVKRRAVNLPQGVPQMIVLHDDASASAWYYDPVRHVKRWMSAQDWQDASDAGLSVVKRPQSYIASIPEYADEVAGVEAALAQVANQVTTLQASVSALPDLIKSIPSGPQGVPGQEGPAGPKGDTGAAGCSVAKTAGCAPAAVAILLASLAPVWLLH